MCAGLTKNRVHPESTDQSHSGVSHVYFLWIISIKCDYTFLSRKSVETWSPIIYCVGVALGLHLKLSSWGKQKSVVKLLYLYIYIYRYNSFTTDFCLPQELSFKWRPKATPTQYIIGDQVSTDFRDRKV